MSRFIPHPSSLILLIALSATLNAQSIHITEKPEGLVHGTLYVPIVASEPVQRIEFFINGVKYSEGIGRTLTVQVNVGQYIRRLRMRAVGYDGQGNAVAEDEMVVNDPRPPFRVRLSAPHEVPSSGSMTLSANVVKPPEVNVAGVDFYIGEDKVGSAAVPPYAASVDVKSAPNAVYARVVAHGSSGAEANDVVFFGERPSESVEVTVQQVPVSVASGSGPVRAMQLSLIDDGKPRKIEALVPAANQPLSVILLIDYSESMLEELPVVKDAARQFAKTLLRPQDRIAVVGFNQRVFWLTGFTNDFDAAAASVDRVKPAGETHLYDTAIEMLFELQKQPGRRALVVLTDGVDQGSAFTLDNLVYYARYAAVPIYPIVKNKMLTRLMRFGIGYLQARRLAQIARDTGATYFIIKGERELPGVYRRIADELRQQYQIAFYSEASAADQWHALAIEDRGGHQLRIPRGYFP
ncbi:MAG TPA: VWA domain-containing protein [Thermoanaerobaculia bacterium]|nr:VWA domain-containing protein [Thermoanaerobaculia bacterium]